jgi:hypothetical protein
MNSIGNSLIPGLVDDVVGKEILPRVPAKNLGQLCTVNKSWDGCVQQILCKLVQECSKEFFPNMSTEDWRSRIVKNPMDALDRFFKENNFSRSSEVYIKSLVDSRYTIRIKWDQKYKNIFNSFIITYPQVRFGRDPSIDKDIYFLGGTLPASDSLNEKLQTTQQLMYKVALGDGYIDAALGTITLDGYVLKSDVEKIVKIATAATSFARSAEIDGNLCIYGAIAPLCAVAVAAVPPFGAAVSIVCIAKLIVDLTLLKLN